MAAEVLCVVLDMRVDIVSAGLGVPPPFTEFTRETADADREDDERGEHSEDDSD